MISLIFTASPLTSPNLEFQPDIPHTEGQTKLRRIVESGMSWKTLLQSVSGSINDHIQLRNEYLMAENRILRNQIDGRVQLTDGERGELAESIGKTNGILALAHR